jgi:regulator of nucleoside diphosphate kinase
MTTDACILTTRDFALLEAMLDRCLGRDDPLAPLLRRKINGAIVMFGQDVPETVATLNSRITYSVEGGAPDTRVLARDRMATSVGMFLPISTLRGLALLGLTEGQTFRLARPDIEEETLLLETVRFQPEAAQRRLLAAERPNASARPTLRLIQGMSEQPQPKRAAVHQAGYDDPGPSAA